MDLKQESLHIGDLGLTPVGINLTRLGDTSAPIEKRLMLIAGMHGDEVSSLPVLVRLLDLLRELSPTELTGTITVVWNANRLAQSLAQRTFPRDAVDLNRIAPGGAHASLPKRIIAKLYDLGKSHGLVVDIHTFGDLCPLIGIHMNAGSPKVVETCTQALNTIYPDLVWNLDYTKSSEATLNGSLCTTLCEAGVSAVALELPKYYRVTDGLRERVVAGLVRLLGSRGMLPPETVDMLLDKLEPSKPVISGDSPLYIKRTRIYADVSGVFYSDVPLLTEVNEGAVLGYIVTLPDLERVEIIAPVSGVLALRKDIQLVSTGDIVASLGV